MTTVNMLEAETNLSRLVRAIVSGDETEVVIELDGKPAARLTAVAPRRKVRLGLAKGKYRLPDDFDRDNDYIAALFEGRVNE